MKQSFSILTAAALLLAGSTASADGALFQAGKSSFESKCAMCHSVDSAAGNAAGPNLHGVVGREIASAAGFSYSQALTTGKGAWDTAKLRAFLQNPQAFAPGNVMPFAGLKNDRERQAVVCFLAGDSNGPACAK